MRCRNCRSQKVRVKAVSRLLTRNCFGVAWQQAPLLFVLLVAWDVTGGFCRQAEAQTAEQGRGEVALFKEVLSDQASEHRALINWVAMQISRHFRREVLRYVDVEKTPDQDLIAYAERKTDFDHSLIMEFEHAGAAGVSLYISMKEVHRDEDSGVAFGEPIYEWYFGIDVNLSKARLKPKIVRVRNVVLPHIHYEFGVGVSEKRLLANCILPLDEDDPDSQEASENLTVAYGDRLRSELGERYATKFINRWEFDYVCSPDGLSEHPGRFGFGHAVSGFLYKDRRGVELYWESGQSSRTREVVRLDAPVNDDTVETSAIKVVEQIVRMEPVSSR